MAIDHDQGMQIAAAYKATWNSESPQSVAGFYAAAGRFVINGGEPWEGRSPVADMAAGFFADVPDLRRLPIQMGKFGFQHDVGRG